MQQAVSLAFARLYKVLVIELLAYRALMGTPHVIFSVGVIEDCGPQRFKVYIVADAVALYRLAAAIDAAARTGHNFHEEIILLSAPDCRWLP